MGYVLALIFAALIFIGGCGINNQIQFNHWTKACNDFGGITSMTHTGFSSNHYECFKNGKQTELRGYK